MFQIILKRLKDLQGENSVSAFARFLEMPQKTVDTYINGQRKPSVEFIMRVCSKCHVTSDWLLGLTNERERADQFGTVPKREEKFQIFSKETNKHLGSVKLSNTYTTKRAEGQELKYEARRQNRTVECAPRS